jgi:predicted ATPase
MWAFAAEPWPTPSPITVRVALNTGTAVPHAGEYYGRAVNRCARIRAVAHPGQVLLSTSSALLIEQSPPQGTRVQRLGRLRLRDLVEPEDVYQLSIDGLPSDFPPPRSLDAVPNNLPLYLTSFVGRDEELARVRGLLAEHRLVTLLGVGGTGKTRLAVQSAAEMLETFAGGIWIAELASITDPDLIEQTLAAALGVTENRGQPLRSAIVERFDAGPSLLVIDNCEHLIEACAHYAGEMLGATQDLRILATSREALGIPGETLLPVPSLGAPDAGLGLEELARHDAVTLFVERASAINAGFALSERNAAAIATVCSRLDGIPLAIELAAARANVLSPDQIAKRLDDRFALLTRGARDAEPRQQTLRGAIDWSYDLLPVEERALFADLSVFAGSFSLEAAEAVAGEKARATGVLDGISRLVERSLVVAETVEERARYHMLETIREYAASRLAESGEQDAAKDAHLVWYLRFTDAAQVGLEGAERTLWRRRIDRELDNIRAATDRAVTEGRVADAARLVSRLRLYWVTRGAISEARNRLEPLLPVLLGGDRAVLQQALAALGGLAQAQGDLVAALRFRQDRLEAARATDGEQRDVAVALHDLGNIESELADIDAARAHYEEALDLFRALGETKYLATLLYNLGNVARMKRELADARARYEEALDIARGSGDRDTESATLFALGAIASNRREYDLASAYFSDALSVARTLGSDPDIAIILTALGGVQIEEGDLAGAKRSLEESRTLHDRLGYRLGVSTADLHLAEIARLEGDVPAARALLDRAMPFIRESRAPRPQSYALEIEADVSRELDDHDGAWRAVRDGLSLRLEMKDAQGVAALLERAAGLLALAGDHDRAAEAFGAAAAARERIGAPVPPSARPRYEADVARVRSALDDATYDEAFARGTKADVTDVAEAVLGASR